MNLEFGDIRNGAADLAPAAQRWRPGRARLRRRLYASLLALDTLAIFLSFFIASRIYGPGATPEQWLLAVLVLLPIYLGAALNGHAYSSEVMLHPGRGVSRALQAFVVAASTIVLVAFCLKASENFSRLTIGLGTLLSFASLGLTRYFFLQQAHKLLGGTPYSTALIAEGSVPIPLDGFSMVIAADDLLDPAHDSPAMFHQLATVLQDVDRVIVACAPERRERWVRVLKGAGTESEVFAPELGSIKPLGFRNWGSTPTIIVAKGPLSKFDTLVKRAFDIVVATAALVLLSPLLLLVALLIKLETPGPVLFVQTRIGLDNRMFKMLKFRSMRVESCDSAGNRSTSRDDQRITRLGAWIRKTSIDELPQLVNVLLGQMSIVGPRPHALGSRAEEKLFWEIDARYWHRHATKPGLTGLAQVRGYRGATLRERDLTDRLQADLEYLNEWSIWKDIKILLLTFSVLVHKNAY